VVQDVEEMLEMLRSFDVQKFSCREFEVEFYPKKEEVPTEDAKPMSRQADRIAEAQERERSSLTSPYKHNSIKLKDFTGQ
jgi:hypothetical protein